MADGLPARSARFRTGEERCRGAPERALRRHAPGSGAFRAALVKTQQQHAIPSVASEPTPPVDADGQRAQGVALMVTAMLLVPMIDVFAKLLGEGGVDSTLARWAGLGPPLPPVEIASARFLVQAVALLPLVLLLAGARALWPRRPGLTALRGALIAITTLLFFASLQVMPVAESISIFFVEPLLLTVLSALILKEPIGWRRISAVALGLCGAMMIVRPNFLAIGWQALLPLGAALCFAFYLLLTKVLAARENALTLHLWAGVAGALLMSGLLALTATGAGGDGLRLAFGAPIAPSPVQTLFLLGLGLIATGGHFLILLAFRRAPASLLAPFQYLEIVSATIFGYLVFNEFPGLWSWLGVAVIVSSGVFVLWRERLRSTGG